MDNFMSIVPSDVTKEISKQLDIRTFSRFLTTCKFANSNTKKVFDNKVFVNTDNIIKEIINSIKSYDIHINEEANKYYLTQVICRTYFQNLINGETSEDRDFLLTLTEEPILKIINEIDATLQDVHTVWNQVVNDDNIEDPFEKKVVECIQKCFFVGEYNVVFELVNSSSEVNYKFIFNITLSDERVLLKVMIIDEEEENDLCDERFSVKLHEYMDNVDITVDGELEFEGTAKNLEGFIQYIRLVFGTGVFSHKLPNDSVDIHICNFINQPFKCCDFYRKAIAEIPITKQASSRIVEVIKSSYIA